MNNINFFFLYNLINKIFDKINYIQQKAKAEVVKKKFNLPKTVEIKYGLLNVYGNFSCEGFCKFLNDITIHANSKVRIGRYTVINGPNTDIYASKNDVIIGSFCSIARNVSIQEFNHDIENFTTSLFEKNINNTGKELIISKGAIEIGHDVWIGSHSVILSGARIGNGAVIAANSVVTGVIPPFAIAGGSPAKIIKYRFDKNKIKKLLASEWWDKIDELNYEKYAGNFDNNSNI